MRRPPQYGHLSRSSQAPSKAAALLDRSKRLSSSSNITAFLDSALAKPDAQHDDLARPSQATQASGSGSASTTKPVTNSTSKPARPFVFTPIHDKAYRILVEKPPSKFKGSTRDDAIVLSDDDEDVLAVSSQSPAASTLRPHVTQSATGLTAIPNARSSITIPRPAPSTQRPEIPQAPFGEHQRPNAPTSIAAKTVTPFIQHVNTEAPSVASTGDSDDDIVYLPISVPVAAGRLMPNILEMGQANIPTLPPSAPTTTRRAPRGAAVDKATVNILELAKGRQEAPSQPREYINIGSSDEEVAPLVIAPTVRTPYTSPNKGPIPPTRLSNSAPASPANARNSSVQVSSTRLSVVPTTSGVTVLQPVITQHNFAHHRETPSHVDDSDEDESLVPARVEKLVPDVDDISSDPSPNQSDDDGDDESEEEIMSRTSATPSKSSSPTAPGQTEESLSSFDRHSSTPEPADIAPVEDGLTDLHIQNDVAKPSTNLEIGVAVNLPQLVPVTSAAPSGVWSGFASQFSRILEDPVHRQAARAVLVPRTRPSSQERDDVVATLPTKPPMTSQYRERDTMTSEERRLEVEYHREMDKRLGFASTFEAMKKVHGPPPRRSAQHAQLSRKSLASVPNSDQSKKSLPTATSSVSWKKTRSPQLSLPPHATQVVPIRQEEDEEESSSSSSSSVALRYSSTEVCIACLVVLLLTISPLSPVQINLKWRSMI